MISQLSDSIPSKVLAPPSETRLFACGSSNNVSVIGIEHFCWKATNRELMDKNSGLTQILQLDTWALVSPEYLQSSPQSSLQESLQQPPPPSVPPLLTSFHPFLPARLTDSISPLTPAESLLPSSLCLTPPYSYWPNKQVSPVNTLTSVRTHKPLSERKRQCECV